MVQVACVCFALCVCLGAAGERAPLWSRSASEAVKVLKRALPYDRRWCESASLTYDARVACSERSLVERIEAWLEWHGHGSGICEYHEHLVSADGARRQERGVGGEQ